MFLVLQKSVFRVRSLLGLPIPNFRLYPPLLDGKSGLEIGGPSSLFSAGGLLPVYQRLGSLDNCDFSDSTVWAEHGRDFSYSPGKLPGKSYFCDGSALTPIADDSYDFVLSCHNLEHFANPMKALIEWKRVLKPGGALLVVLPYYRTTFDHRRTPTTVAHMIADYENNTGEDDLTHLPEILEKHDLARDPGAGSIENFRRRSQDNFNQRCLHHHVFDAKNSRALIQAAGFESLAADLAPGFHICQLARKPQPAVH